MDFEAIPANDILMIGIFISWGLACFHTIYAHVVSPEASPIRAFWNNRYTPKGKFHLKLQLVWTIATAVFTFLVLENR